jgi:hypothetical protein|tara:strand:- start:158 stop:664 length:507 start_codon:yes stop_codon:yes gene_type:complete
MTTKETKPRKCISQFMACVISVCQFLYIVLAIHDKSFVGFSSLANVGTMFFDIGGILWILIHASLLANTISSMLGYVFNDPNKSFMNLVCLCGCSYLIIVHHGMNSVSEWNPFGEKNLVTLIGNKPGIFLEIENRICGNMNRVNVPVQGILLTRLGSGCGVRATFVAK